MNYQLLLPLLVTTIVVIIGWIVGHKLNARRDRINKHLDLRLQFLVAAYRKLAYSAGRKLEQDSQAARDQEEAFADIQLFGTQDQINQLLSSMTPGGDISSVLNMLRDELRNELHLPPVKGNVKWVRY